MGLICKQISLKNLSNFNYLPTENQNENEEQKQKKGEVEDPRSNLSKINKIKNELIWAFLSAV